MNELTTEEFWEKMCCLGFYRVSRHEGVIGVTRYHTNVPPEMVEGFLSAKIKEAARLLGFNEDLTDIKTYRRRWWNPLRYIVGPISLKRIKARDIYRRR